MTPTTPIHDLLAQARARRDYYIKLVSLLEPLIAQLHQSQDSFAREVSILTRYPRTPEVADPPPPPASATGKTTRPSTRDCVVALLRRHGPRSVPELESLLLADGWTTAAAEPRTILYNILRQPVFEQVGQDEDGFRRYGLVK